ncbi:alpha/beta fold hydrolase [Pseudomonas matsuisoli]|uniref:Alpha/beta hydrolase n=1 Tax=Pseudomonas matsuisoli TaxID=1515666 RepID=A0A917UWL2_9PSED|nr:alpha/beta hydrolase [Pseudomonas matsuisoli]GGJ92197.1 alpha/beta hydrolase [Pseudomonas matsuisoli]
MRRLLPALFLASATPVMAAETPSYGAMLEEFDYDRPVERFEFQSQGEKLQMAYIDVKPENANGRTVVLMHGKNFCAGTWEGSIKALSDAGYRVIAPDQIGFCKSTKPLRYQYSFHQLAHNTHDLLDHLKIDKATILGHSTGGMLATRYALLYPDQVEQLVMVNPIGLEDWKVEGVPYQTVDQWYANEAQTTAEGIREYERKTYYAGDWKPEYDRWVNMLAGLFNGPGKNLVAWNSALLYDMIYSQPVVYEFGQLKAPTLLLIGLQDNTAIGKAKAPKDIQAKLGNYPELGKRTAKAIPNSTLVEFEKLGHAPQIQAPAEFHEALLKGLSDLKS